VGTEWWLSASSAFRKDRGFRVVRVFFVVKISTSFNFGHRRSRLVTTGHLFPGFATLPGGIISRIRSLPESAFNPRIDVEQTAQRKHLI
jgi:hypothetical protein